MPPTLEQLSLALADSLDDRPLGMVTNDLTVGQPLVWWANRLHPRMKVVEQRGAASFPGRRGIKVHLIKAEHLVSFPITIGNIWSCLVFLSRILSFLQLCELWMHHFLHFSELIAESRPTRTRAGFMVNQALSGVEACPHYSMLSLCRIRQWICLPQSLRTFPILLFSPGLLE